MNDLYSFLRGHDSAAWRRALDEITPEIRDVDRHATRIWFAFFPLDLHRLLEDAAADGTEAALVHKLVLMGRWRLADQVDSSHRFLFAHRYWPQVKSAIASLSEWPDSLPGVIRGAADAAARTARVDRELLLGISAVGLMTLRQAGVASFAAAPGTVHIADRARAMTPHQVMSRRAKDDWQGVLGFARGSHKRWTVTFDENTPDSTFVVINGQEIASAAQNDKRDYRSRDARCIPGEGPIPVECRAASCGTCWVGVLGGAEKLSPVVERDEGRRLTVFGYGESSGPNPIIRLACQARAFGAVSLVIPPWNGIFGKALK